MIDHIKKEEIIAKILASNEFNNKDVYQKLLSYLFECTSNESIPKEYSIAVDVLEKESDFDPSKDPSVRYRIYKLRDKLEKYYREEGKNETVKVEIPKGHYILVFTEDEKNESNGHSLNNLEYRKYKKYFYLALVITLLSVITTIYFITNSSLFRNNPYKEFKIWNSHFNNNFENLLIIGDYFIFEEYDSLLEYRRRIMDYRITNDEELKKYSENFKDRKIFDNPIGEAPHNSIINLIDILPVYYKFNETVNLKWTKNLKFDEFEKRNFIYIGDFGNMRIIKNLLKALTIQIDRIDKWTLEVNIVNPNLPDSIDKKYSFKPEFISERDYFDYGVIVKIPGFNDEDYLIVAGIQYISQVELVRMISKIDRITELEKEIIKLKGYVPDYFEILFRVTGFNYTSYHSEMLYFNEIDPDDYLLKKSKIFLEKDTLQP